MILFTDLAFLAVAIMTGAIKHWQKYYATVLFVSFSNLLYNLICKDYLTWSFHPDFLLNRTSVEVLNSLVLLPSVTILYLYFFPKDAQKVYIYYLGWIALFFTAEYIWFLYSRISYHRGWNLVWSIVFYFAMFLVIRLHHTSRAKAILFSFAFVVFLLTTFKITFWK